MDMRTAENFNRYGFKVTLIGVLVVLCLGCRFRSDGLVDQKSDVIKAYEIAREQDRSWEHNRQHAKYVPGRGYHLADTGQYYNASGRPLGNGDEKIQTASFDDASSDELVEKPIKDSSPFRPRNVLDQYKAAIGKGPSRDRARKVYEDAERSYREAISASGETRQEQLLETAETYGTAANAWPDSALEEDALFKEAECYYFSDDYPEAEDRYEAIVKKYPNSRYLDLISVRRFEIAKYWLATHRAKPTRRLRPNLSNSALPRFDTFGHAVKLFDRIRIDDPAGKLSDDATIAAGNAYFKAENYHRADQLYTDLRDAFPDSEHQFDAHLLGLKCKLLIYQGPNYDEKPLQEATKLVKRIKRQFHQEYEEKREMVDQSFAEVHARLADRDWLHAQYYDRRRETQGARFYYDRIARTYEGTKVASEAQQRLEELSTEVNESPSRLSAIKGFLDRQGEELPPLLENPEPIIQP
ncbi:MAG: hypothetical protein CMJ81_14925 [Planctomycetaceae bacterium]|nr:hypothetical protein [Planctomycetaceae bacterium]MBP61800.1 hypothetical protein [Planctomycetaceae bacterium]